MSNLSLEQLKKKLEEAKTHDKDETVFPYGMLTWGEFVEEIQKEIEIKTELNKQQFSIPDPERKQQQHKQAKVLKVVANKVVKRPEKPNYQMECIYCHQPFYASRNTAMYCSEWCGRQYRSKHRCTN